MSATIFFISDLHLGHDNILKFFRPQFNDITEHNEFIVDEWNSIVKPKDVVYVLGDVAFDLDGLRHIKYCNGNKHLIKGNHDNLLVMDYVDVGFQKIEGCMRYKEFVLSHVPIHENCMEFNWRLNIHGHIHEESKNIPDKRYINVNVDVVGFKPLSLETIRYNINQSL